MLPSRSRSAPPFFPRSGYRQALLLLLGGLKRLEYRGYDSSGVGLMVATDKGPSIRVMKKQGKVTNLEAATRDAGVDSTVGIAHTRWATHGLPNDVNAHPHTDAARTVAVVHNGIIENYQTLKAALIGEGCAAPFFFGVAAAPARSLAAPVLTPSPPHPLHPLPLSRARRRPAAATSSRATRTRRCLRT